MRGARSARRAVARVAFVAVVALIAPGVTASPAAAQSLALGAGAAMSTPLLIDGNGTTVRVAAAPYVGLDVAPHLARGAADPVTRFIGSARLARARVTATDRGTVWTPGRAWQAEVTAGVVHRLTRSLRARAAVGATVLVGPRDVAPFDATRVAPVAEVGLDVRVRAALRADVRGQVYRIGPDRGTSGVVGRLLVGAAYAP